MSEVVTGGIAAAAVGACAAAIGLVAGAAYLTYRGLVWLSAQAEREVELLEKELAAPSTHVSTAEARAEFERQFAELKAKAAGNPHLKDHADELARLLALKHSPLGVFLNQEQRNEIRSPRLNRRSFSNILDQAARRFTKANTVYVTRSLIDVAKDAGFSTERFSRQIKGKQTLVLEDSLGRALVAEIVESDHGANLNLDLTGFGDGSCHGVMDKILNDLAERQINLGRMRRRSHYRREGVTELAPSHTQSENAAPPVFPDQERREADRRRRRQGHEPSKLRFNK